VQSKSMPWLLVEYQADLQTRCYREELAVRASAKRHDLRIVLAARRHRGRGGGRRRRLSRGGCGAPQGRGDHDDARAAAGGVRAGPGAEGAAEGGVGAELLRQASGRRWVAASALVLMVALARKQPARPPSIEPRPTLAVMVTGNLVHAWTALYLPGAAKHQGSAEFPLCLASVDPFLEVGSKPRPRAANAV
jgi:hypothetical protein